MLDFRNVSDERAELYNRVGDPFVAIHLWSSDSPVGQQVVLPFVKEFEPKLLGSSGQNRSSGSGRAAFDPRHQSQEESDMDRLLGDDTDDIETPVHEAIIPDAPYERHTLHAQPEQPKPHGRRPHRRGGEYYDSLKGVGSN